MRPLAFVLVFVAPPPLKPWILRALLGARVGRGVSIGWFSSVSARRVDLGDGCVVRPLTLIQCDSGVTIGRYAEVSSFCLIYGCSTFSLGDRSYVGPQSLINASEPVTVGTMSALGPRTMVFTHGSFLPYTEGYWVKFAPVTVGDRVWTGAGCFFNPGTEVGDHVFVNAVSVLSGSVASGAVVEGNPAREVTQMAKLKRHVTPARRDQLIVSMMAHLARFLRDTGDHLQVDVSTPQEIVVSNGRRRVRTVLVPSVATTAPAGDVRDLIALVNAKDLAADLIARGAVVFDFTTMRAARAGSGLADEVYLFFKRYYGVIFERD